MNSQLADATAAYLAGLIDGEGTVTLTQEHRNERRRLVVSISSTERQLLEFVLSAVNAGRITNKRTYQAHHTPSYAYKVTNRQALDLLRQVQPFMRGYKAHRAAYALTHYIAVTPRNGRYTTEQAVAREAFDAAFLQILPHTRKGAVGIEFQTE